MPLGSQQDMHVVDQEMSDRIEKTNREDGLIVMSKHGLAVSGGAGASEGLGNEQVDLESLPACFGDCDVATFSVGASYLPETESLDEEAMMLLLQNGCRLAMREGRLLDSISPVSTVQVVDLEDPFKLPPVLSNCSVLVRI